MHEFVKAIDVVITCVELQSRNGGVRLAYQIRSLLENRCLPGMHQISKLVAAPRREWIGQVECEHCRQEIVRNVIEVRLRSPFFIQARQDRKPPIISLVLCGEGENGAEGWKVWTAEGSFKSRERGLRVGFSERAHEALAGGRRFVRGLGCRDGLSLRPTTSGSG